MRLRSNTHESQAHKGLSDLDLTDRETRHLEILFTSISQSE